MALTHHILFQMCFSPLLISPPASSPTFPHFQALSPPSCSVLSSITVFLLPFIFTWLFLSACCTTLSQPNGIAGEHVSLSLLSTTPALIARKLMKQRTRMTPLLPLFASWLSSLLHRPPSLNIFSLVSLLFSFPDWIIILAQLSSAALYASQHKSFIIYLLGISFDFFFGPTSLAACAPNATCSVFTNTFCPQFPQLHACRFECKEQR